MNQLDTVKPKVRELGLQLVAHCLQSSITISVTQGFRTFAEQNTLYAKGRTVPGQVVTNARGGQSLHNYGVAFDICPIIGGKYIWSDNSLFASVGQIGQSLGLEWGGSWTSFQDRPHFQYLAGYKLADFQSNKVQWSRFEVSVPVQPLPPTPIVPLAVQFKTYMVMADLLNVRSGPGTTFGKIGQLGKWAILQPIQLQNGWFKYIRPDGSAGWVNATFVA